MVPMKIPNKMQPPAGVMNRIFLYFRNPLSSSTIRRRLKMLNKLRDDIPEDLISKSLSFDILKPIQGESAKV
jgi:hypothetical protein